VTGSCEHGSESLGSMGFSWKQLLRFKDPVPLLTKFINLFLTCSLLTNEDNQCSHLYSSTLCSNLIFCAVYRYRDLQVIKTLMSWSVLSSKYHFVILYTVALIWNTLWIHHRLSNSRHDDGFEVDIMANSTSSGMHPVDDGEHQLLGRSRVFTPQHTNEDNSHHSWSDWK
jgi:hypothetical protein